MGLRLLTRHDGFNYLTGGIPSEGITNIWGKPSAGKTAISRMIVRDLARTEQVLVFAADKTIYRQVGDYLKVAGDDYEAGLCVCLDYLATGSIVIIDDLSSMMPSSDIVGAPGRMVAHFLQTAKDVMNRTGGALVVTSQVRMKGYAYQNALSAHTDMEVRLKQKEVINDELGARIGRWTLLDIRRNRELKPNAKGRLLIRLQKDDYGLTTTDGFIDGAVLRGEMQINGTWWKAGQFKAQGRENLFQLLRESQSQP